jgi:hypothetical protein
MVKKLEPLEIEAILNSIKNLVDGSKANLNILKSEDGFGMDLNIQTIKSEYCPIYLSITKDIFDISIANKFSCSDIPHDDFDLYEILTSIIEGKIKIYSPKKKSIFSSETAEVDLHQDRKFFMSSAGMKIHNITQYNISEPFESYRA